MLFEYTHRTYRQQLFIDLSLSKSLLHRMNELQLEARIRSLELYAMALHQSIIDEKGWKKFAENSHRPDLISIR